MKNRLRNMLSTHSDLCIEFYNSCFLLCKVFLIMNMSLPSGLAKCTCDNMHVFGDLQNANLSGKLDMSVTFGMSPHHYSYINCPISFWIVLFSFTIFHLTQQVQFMDVSFQCVFFLSKKCISYGLKLEVGRCI
jgi:hypothetical protein